MEIELPENEKEKIHTKVSSYSLSSVELKKTVTHSNKKKKMKIYYQKLNLNLKILKKI